MKRADEEHAKTAWHRHLELVGVDDLAWNVGDEPPDYYLDIPPKRYAVEVTAITDYELIGGRQLPSRTLASSLRRICEKIQQITQEVVQPKGAYLLEVEPVPEPTTAIRQASRHVVSYIKITADLPRAPRQIVHGSGQSKWCITKLHNERAYLGYVISW